MNSRATGSVARFAVPMRALAQRFSFLLLVLLSIALMMIGKIDAVLVEGLRARVTDAFAPILEVFAEPAATAARFVEDLSSLTELRAENARLRAENERLRQWQQAALRLDAENRSLRALLNFKSDPAARYITARVIADPGGAFARTLVVTAGRRDGVRKGLAVVAGEGLVGRVVAVGEWSARILLVTDINARIPVVLESSRQRAVMGGDNSPRPRLHYLPPEAAVQVGDRVVTSGHGGVFPPGLPVGVVASVADGVVRVEPFVDASRVEHVQLIDYGLSGGLASEAVQPGVMQ